MRDGQAVVREVKTTLCTVHNQLSTSHGQILRAKQKWRANVSPCLDSDLALCASVRMRDFGVYVCVWDCVHSLEQCAKHLSLGLLCFLESTLLLALQRDVDGGKYIG